MSGQQSSSRNATADRALEVLGLFSESRRAVGAHEVAEALSVSRSTAYRYLQSLVISGFLEEHQRGGYQLGPRIAELARLVVAPWDLAELALPVMRELAKETSETVLLMRRSGDRVICVERVETAHRVRISYERGSSFPLNAGASALVLLAGLDDAAATALLLKARLPQYTHHTTTDPRVQLARLAAVRADGYAITRGELDDGVVGIATPVRRSGQEIIASLGVAGLEARLGPRLDDAVAATVAAAGSLSALLA